MTEGRFVRTHQMNFMPFMMEAQQKVYEQLQAETPEHEDMPSLTGERALGWLGINFPHQLVFELVCDAHKRNTTYDGTPKIDVPRHLYTDVEAKNQVVAEAGELIAYNINRDNRILYERRAVVEQSFAEAVISEAELAAPAEIAAQAAIEYPQ